MFKFEIGKKVKYIHKEKIKFGRIINRTKYSKFSFFPFRNGAGFQKEMLENYTLLQMIQLTTG